MKFKDLFSGHAKEYSRYRPGYPDALFRFVANNAPDTEIAWDCATGSGQTALGLTPHFSQIFASDASARQIENAYPHEQITYYVGTAYHSGLQYNSIDAVTVSQALHWFDFDAFFGEVRRVLTPEGVLAAWCYMKPSVSPELDAIISEFTEEIVGPYWPPERKHVDNGYANIDFPFEEIEAPEFRAEHHWDLEHFFGYLNTWSAAKRFQQDNGYSPIDEIRARVATLWKNPDREKVVTWPIRVRMGRNE
ncbi:MAG: putative methyltransferase [Candidatus Marinimicrobia bacterium]|nr:putative methyltransferase [Candidatus Neomarinimicrobiota bacterium]